MAPVDIPLPPAGKPFSGYDVDALLQELGGDVTAEAAPETDVCRRVEDFYGAAGRFAMADALAEFLEGRRLTPTELLHAVEPQRWFAEWSGRAAALERVARDQAREARQPAAARLEELRELERQAMARTAERAAGGAPTTLDARGFAAAVARAQPGFDGRFQVEALLAGLLGACATYEMKLLRLLSLDSEALAPVGVEILDQVAGEILASPAAVEELFGWAKGIRVRLEALAQLWKGDTVSHPAAPALVRRLSAFIGGRAPGGARRGIEATLHRALMGDERLTPANSYDPRALSTIVDELEALGALATKLTHHGRSSGGELIGGRRTAALLDRRAAALLAEERLETVLQGKSLYARILDLLVLEEAAVGERSRKIVLTALQRILEGRDFTQRLFESARTPRARIKALSDVQRRILRSCLPEAWRDRQARMLDEVQNTYLRTNRIMVRIGKDKTPTVDEVMEFATLLAEGAFTDGKCAGGARDLVAHHVRNPGFLRGYLNRWKNETERRAERFAQFFATLAGAGTPLRDMGTLSVLLADDELQARSYVEMILRDLGITRITVAEDGREALTRFEERETDFDLIICDWKMPRLSGLEFLKQVRATRPEMPFLMVTALATMIAVEEAMAHDVTAYIAKPFSPEQLEEKILVLVNR